MAGYLFDINTKYRAEAQLYGIGDPMGFIIYLKKDGSRLAELFIDEKTVRVSWSRLTPSVQASIVTNIRKKLPSIKYNYFS